MENWEDDVHFPQRSSFTERFHYMKKWHLMICVPLVAAAADVSTLRSEYIILLIMVLRLTIFDREIGSKMTREEYANDVNICMALACIIFV